MTGIQLAVKLTVWERLVSAVQPKLSLLFRWINSFIGSLTRALPGLELVKEYEEHVELTIEHQSDTPPRVPISIVRE